MTYPTFNNGDLLPASDLNAIGLWLVASQAVGTGVSSVTLTPFSANYENYRILWNGFTASTNASLSMQLNNSVGSTYRGSGIFMTFGSTTINGYGPAAAVRWTDIAPAGTTAGYLQMDIYQPFLSAPTRARTTGNNDSGFYDFGLSDTTPQISSGFTLTHSSGGTLTGGTIRVYGYRN